jgi:hypothetical protein
MIYYGIRAYNAYKAYTITSIFHWLLLAQTNFFNFAPPSGTLQNYLKPDNLNYTMWLTQFKPILRAHELMGIVDCTEPCLLQFLPND